MSLKQQEGSSGDKKLRSITTKVGGFKGALLWLLL
jgi:hypothetical protein